MSNEDPRKRYSAEFKASAVELLSTGKPVTEVAQELCISSNLLYNWRQQAQRAQGTQVGSAGSRAAGERSQADDLRALRRENALLRQENDILKKAAIILGTRPPSGSAK
jgi:transposase